MNFHAYKACAVPLCTSTTIKTPEKLFIHVPQTVQVRQKWLQLARRDHETVSPKYSMYFCEDHFDMPNDMENYMVFKIMGSVAKIRMKPHCLPSKFDCQQNQKDQKKRVSTSMSTSLQSKKQRTMLMCNLENREIKDLAEPSISSTTNNLGLPISAQEAYDSGLVTKVVPAEQLDEEVNKIVDSIKHKSRSVIALGKQFYYKQIDLSLLEAYGLGEQIMVKNINMNDGQEGIKSFVEKRKAKWNHK